MAILSTAITYGGATPSTDPDGNILRANMIFDPIFNDASFQALGYQIRDNIQYSESMYNWAPADKVTRIKTTCGFTPHGTLGTLSDKTITVAKLKVEMEQCADDFDGTILALGRKRGVKNSYDLTGTVIEEIIRDLAAPIIGRDLRRIIALGDTASANPDYSMVDGVWKKIVAGVAGATIVKAADLPDRGAGGETPALAADAAIVAMTAVYFDSPLELKSVDNANKRFVVSRSIYENYQRSLITQGAGYLESVRTTMLEGYPTLTFMGIPLVISDLVDTYATADYATLAFDAPHRIYLTTDNNITIGTDLESDFTEIDFWYEKKPEMNYMRAAYKLGVGFAYDKLFSVAY